MVELVLVMKRAYAVLNRIVGIGFICIILAVMAVGLSKPQHNLIPGQMMAGVLAASCFFVVLYMCMNGLGKKIKFLLSDKLFVVLAMLWGAVLVAVGVICRNSSVSFLDYEICYRSAMEYATTGAVTDGMYFSVYPHNWKCVLVIASIFKMGMGFGFKDPYYFLLIVNALLMEGTLFSCRYLLKEFGVVSKAARLMLLVMFGACLPLYAFAQTFYTDSASFGFGVMGIAVFHKAYYGVKSKALKAVWYVVSGVLICMGYTMKVTSLIVVIAAVMGVLITGVRKGGIKKVLPGVVFALAGLCLFSFAMEKAAMKDAWYRDKEMYEYPLLSYVAMGLRHDGTYYENREFKIAMDDLTYSDEKAEFSKEYVRENIDGLWDGEHIVAKMRANYASGNLGAGDFARYSYGEDNLLNRMFNYDGDLYWYACKYNMIFMFQIYLIMAVGALVAVLRLNRLLREKVTLISTAELTFIGYFVFLFIWEANNRQLFNMLPELLTGYVVSLTLICDSIRLDKWKRKPLK